MRLLVRPGSMPAIRGLLLSLLLLCVLSLSYFVLALIDGCALTAAETAIFGRYVWAGLHIGLLAAAAILSLAFVVERGALLQVSIVGGSSSSGIGRPRPYRDLYNYYRILLVTLLASLFLSALFIVPVAFMPSQSETRFKDWLGGFPLGWISMMVPILLCLGQLCRLWGKLEPT